MKTKYKLPVILSLLLLGFASCDEEEFLKEVPLDFYSPENAFSTVSGFEASLVALYTKERDLYFALGDVSFSQMYGSDMYMHGRGTGDSSTEKMSNLSNALTPSVNSVKTYWNKNYDIIAVANTIIKYSANSTLPKADLLSLTAEAKFFRAKAYRDLVYLYGDVPLILEPVTVPRYDYVRAPKKEVLEQMAVDLQDAAKDLLPITQVKDGRISKPVANHYLAETLLSLGRANEALVAASAVISSPDVRLMTARFGRRTSVFGKDVMWDMFQRGNQNRASGNKEALWVAQIQEDAIGGLVVTTRLASANNYERAHAPATWSLSKTSAPIGRFQGRKGDDNVGGFGISNLQPTPYLNNTNPPAVAGTTPGVWPAGYVGDMRCNNNNFIKDAKYDDPTSALNGQSILAPGNRPTNWGVTSEADLSKPIGNASWRWYQWFVKCTTPNDYPTAMLDPNHPTGYNQANLGATFHDQYYLRLAETLLLRAEIYAALGNNALALQDINTVRSRAGAAPFTGTVTIDYILDERARELPLEEQRTITLHRLGVYVRRVKACNPMSAPTAVDVKHELWPIPQEAIDTNRDAVLPQNPGYN
jgi:starch-binding outer membrane protein, SusD/RagB family